MFRLIQRNRWKGLELKQYATSTGGGMAGGTKSTTLSVYQDRALLTYTSSEWHDQDPTVTEYLISKDALQEIREIFLDEGMYRWEGKSFTKLFVADGETTSYDFIFSGDSIRFSSQIYPYPYGEKLAKLDAVIGKYSVDGEKLPGLVLPEQSEEEKMSSGQPQDGKVTMRVYEYSQNTLNYRIMNGTDADVMVSGRYVLVDEAGNVIASNADQETLYDWTVSSGCSTDDIVWLDEKRLKEGNYTLKIDDLSCSFEIRMDSEISSEVPEEMTTTAPAGTASAAVGTVHLEREDWADDVKKAVNDLIDCYGISSGTYDDTSYVVFDFDNTTSIFDVEEQLAIYQLQTMAFAVTPEKLPEVLATGLSNLNADLTELGYGKGSYEDWIADISAAYTILYDAYGPFDAAGLGDEEQKKIQADPEWQEFATKMRAMYDLIAENESAAVAYPWILYWFTGMTEDEVYALAARSHTFYRDVETSALTWTCPETMDSLVGPVSYTWTSGIQVTENMKELWKVLDENGIDVWVCSASGTDVIRAGIDTFGLHEHCTGMLAMTNQLEGGRYINAYDYETGCCWYAKEDGSWEKGTEGTKAQTQGAGKVTAINNTLVKEYGHGPLCGFMDSTGDFNFCSEYETLKLVVCFNRASRKVTDGGGLVAEVAMYERDSLGYDLAAANAAGDTLYVLQGRDENGMRTFRNSNKTLVLGSAEEKLFKNEENEAQLKYMIDNKMPVKDVMNKLAMKTAADDPKNELGFTYGFLQEYAGYHARK